MEIGIEKLGGAAMWTETGRREAAGKTVGLEVPADKVATTRLFVAAPPAGEAREPVIFAVRALDEEGGSDREESFFERPGEGS
jgi:hypothetical protein